VLIERELARFERLEAAQAAIQAVTDAGGEVHYHQVDLTSPDAVAAVVDEIRGGTHASTCCCTPPGSRSAAG
jgi:NAD(P)-dependent dehydrogenase (short-subunit alcohol dehydrogenase family)